ncbi:mitochondrial deoxynucleotide carrier [Terfezia claveryi]|nr:mitochondrial deoxynucleotide carrier [Terfezia claveryi]
MSSNAHHIGKKEKASKQHVAIAGSVAGLMSRFVIAPLDVVKIRLQLQHHALSPTFTLLNPSTLLNPPVIVTPNGPVYHGILPTIRTIIHQEGITGLWKGNIPAELLYLTYGAVQFLVFRQITRLITKTGYDVPDPLKNAVAGASAGAIATTVTYPCDLLRTRFASQGAEKIYSSILSSIRQIYTSEGPTGFFRGLSAGIIGIVPYMGIFFCTYESTRNSLHRTNLSHGTTDAFSGTFAAVIAKTGVFPLDLIRKRLQVQGPTRELYIHRNIPVYSGIWKTARKTVSQEGWRGLYRGLTVALLKAAPASAATMWTFETTMRVLKWKDGVED